MAPTDIRTSVIIATHGRPDLLRRTLKTLTSPSNRAALEDAEVLVVENGGRHGAEEACRELHTVLPIRYTFVEEAGKSHALNVAVERTEADFLIFFDDDVRIDSGVPAAFREAALRYGPGYFFGGPVAIDYEEPPPDWLIPFLTPAGSGWTLGEEEVFHDTPDFMGANWAAFRRDIREAGGFRRQFGPDVSRVRTIASETDLQKRLLARGHRGVYLPRARVWHWVPRDRCTVRWARTRRFQVAVTDVLRDEEYLEPFPLIAGVPRFLWRQCAEDAVRVLLARIFLPKGPRRLRCEMRAARSWGRAVGFRVAFRLRDSEDGRGGPDATTGRSGP